MAEIHKWHGFRELEQNLKMLGAEVHEKGVKRMMSRAAVPMRDEAKRNAPVLQEPHRYRTPGLLREMVKIWRQRKTPYAVTYFVGVRRGRQSAMKDAFYWFWQEFGSSRQKAANGGRGFLRPAFESKKMESVKVALDEGRAFLRRTVRRLKRTKR